VPPKTQNCEKEQLIILVPIFNDWQAVSCLLERLGKTLSEQSNIESSVWLIDDCSTEEPSWDQSSLSFPGITKVCRLTLRRNLGHQRAITVGLAYLAQNTIADAIIVMDGDGEDNPADIIRLINKYKSTEQKKIIFARRKKRTESFLFRFNYFCYKQFFYFFTGQQIRFGNFSLIPFHLLARLVAVSDIWNHYAAGILRSRLPYAEISINRGSRLAGKAQMNFYSLLLHGLSAISVYSDVVGVRFLIISFVFIVFASLLITVVAGIKFLTVLAIPGWATYTCGMLSLLIGQAALASLFFIFLILNSRSSYAFIPLRDHTYFVLKTETILHDSHA